VVSEGLLIAPRHENVDCGAFYEVIIFLHLAHESAWGPFLQPKRLTSADGKSDAFGDPMKGLGYFNIFIMCRARFSSISLCRGTGCFLPVLGFK
jgi:hypothetical protein